MQIMNAKNITNYRLFSQENVSSTFYELKKQRR